MRESIFVYWGGHDRKAARSGYKVTGKLKITKDKEKEVEPIAITVDGTSCTVNESVDVQVRLNMSRAMIYDLFEKALSFEQHDKPELARVGKALLEGLRK